MKTDILNSARLKSNERQNLSKNLLKSEPNTN